MIGGSGLGREKLHLVHLIGDTSRRDKPSADSGVIEENFRLELTEGGLPPEEVDRALFAFRKSLLAPEHRGTPVGRVALGESPLQ